MHMGVMDRGFTVPIKISLFVHLYTRYKLRATQWIFILSLMLQSWTL
jgi:hypothetical protein